jgi:protocatechuate 3,4-dioxygenase beta subunit/photosystem II stability/assembly factor-like uncharacterized protein
MAVSSLRRWWSVFQDRAAGLDNRRAKSKARLALERLEGREVPSTNIPLNGNTWTEIGPKPIVNGESPGRLPATGRFDSVTVDPTNSNIIYAASAVGGIWRSTNGGTTWSPRTDTFDATNTPINSATLIRMVHRTPANTIYASSAVGADAFFYFSNDGAETFTRIGTTTFTNRRINEFIVIPDPTDPNNQAKDLIYAAVQTNATDPMGAAMAPSGIYRSNDGGATWVNITANGFPFAQVNQLPFFDIDVDPTNREVIYATVNRDPTLQSAVGVYRCTNAFSTDGMAGMNVPLWDLRLGGSAFFSGTLPTRLQTAVSPVLPSVIFVTTSAANFQVLYRTTDTGINWTPLLSTSFLPAPVGTVPDFVTAQGVGGGTVYGRIFIDPASPANPTQQRVYLGGFGDTDSAIVVSANSGGTWSNITVGSNGNSPYIGIRDIVADANNRPVLATEGGIYRLSSASPVIWQSLNGSIGGALNTTQVAPLGQGLHPTDQNQVIINDAPFHSAARFNDTGPNAFGWTTIDNQAGPPFHTIPVPPNPIPSLSPLRGIGTVIYDFNNPNTVYRMSAGSIRRSDDGGTTWRNTDLPFTTPGAFVMNPSDNRLLFSAGVQDDVYVYFATQEASFTIEELTGLVLPSLEFFGAPGTVTAIGISRQSNLVYVATTPGLYEWELEVNPMAMPTTRMYVLDLSGTLAPDWFELNLPMGFGTTQITQITVDPNNPLNVYFITNDGRVFNQRAPQFMPMPPAPMDPGPPPPNLVATAQWQQLNPTGGMNMPPQSIVANATGTTAMALDPRISTNPNDDILYIGTNNGVYRLQINPTQTSNFVWQRVGGAELPNNPVRDLDINTTTGILSVGLNGRGVWQFQIRSLVRGRKFSDLNGNGVFDPNEPGQAGVVIQVRDQATNSIIATTVTDAQGFYEFRSLPTGTYRIEEITPANSVQTTALVPFFTITETGSAFPSFPTTPVPPGILVIPELNIGNFQNGTISGVKFEDANQNGVREANEIGLPGFTIFIDGNDNGILDWTDLNGNGVWNPGEGEQWVITGVNGTYSLTGLGPPVVLGMPAGANGPPYRVREVVPPGWVQTTANPAPITPGSGQQILGVNFGNFRPNTISGVKFHDLDGDGAFDPGEPGLAGWTIFLDLNFNGTLDMGEPSQVTNANGFFEFIGLANGTYRVREVQQPGWTQTTLNPADVTLTGSNSANGIVFGNFQSVNPWYEMGPRPILSGQAPGQRPATGRFDSITVDPTNPNVLYAASSVGGIWRSTDGGLNWSVRSDSLPNLSVTKIQAIARAGANTVYATTGNGIYKSTDGGLTFSLFGAATFTGRSITAMDVRANSTAPNDPNQDLLFVATVGGVFRSIDGGSTWVNITSRGFPFNPNAQFFVDVDIDPQNPNVVYACVGNRMGGATNGVYRISNALTAGPLVDGAWTLQIGGSAFFPGVTPGTIQLSISPSAPSVLFASVAERDSPNGGVSRLLGIFRSVDSGVNWTGLYNPQVVPSGNVPNFMNNTGNDNNTIIVSPFSPNNPNQQIVFAAGYGDSANNVIVSLDSGNTWQDISVGPDGNGAYVGVHGASIDSLGRLLIATDGGIYRLNSRSPVTWQSLNGATVGLTALNTVTVPPGGYAAHPTDPYQGFANAGQYHTAVIYNGRFPAGFGWRTTDSPDMAPFHNPTGPGSDGTGVVFYDFNNPLTMFRIVNATGANDNQWIRRSTDGGLTWVGVADQVPGQLPGNNLYPVIMDPSNSQRLFAGTEQVSVSNDGGNTWTTILQTSITSTTPIPPLPTTGASPPINITALGVGRTTGTLIYAATAAGNLFAVVLPDAAPPATPAAQDDWVDLAPPLGPFDFISQIIVDPDNSRNIYCISAQGQILNWFQGQWTRLNDAANGVPPSAPGAFSIALDSRAATTPLDDILYVGTSSGVFRLINPSRGTNPGPYNWSRVGTGLPNIAVTSLSLNTTTGLLSAGTAGRGVWQIQIRALIAGEKFEDTNGNGIRDVGEPGMAGVVIQVLDANNMAVIATTTTDANGLYEFRSLREGNYIVREFGVAGTVQTTTNPMVITLAETDSAVNVYTGQLPMPAGVQIIPQLAFGNFRFGTISGVKFEDRNGNGVRDAGEPGLAGFVIYIDANDNGMRDWTDLNGNNLWDPGEGEQWTTTDLVGNYTFTNIGPAVVNGVPTNPPYIIREIQQTGFIQTSPTPTPFTIMSGQNVTGVNIGNIRIGRIEGFVFNDLNGDGVQQAGEGGLGGITLQLVDAVTGTVFRSVMSAADGTYQFLSIPAGDYQLRQALPAGFVQTFPAPPNPTFYSIMLAATDQVSGFTFGNFQLFSISGVKFEDLNGNGAREPGENGVPNFVIQLTNLTTGAQLNAVTDAFGNYTFTNLGPGVYQIREVQRPGWLQTTPNPADIAGTSGVNRPNTNFGNFRLVTATGTVFNDRNRNGVRDVGEEGLPGFTVFLDRGNNGTIDATAVTDANGNYSFGTLGPGSYTIRQQPRRGWTIISPTSGEYNFTAVSSTNPTGLNFGNANTGTYATGQDAGGSPTVVIRRVSDNVETLKFMAYAPSFRGGVRVATGFTEGNTIPVVVTGAGPGGGPHVRVFNSNTGDEIWGFFAFDPRFAGGVNVAVGDVDADGYDDIIVGADAGGGPHVRVFSGRTRQEIMSFFAYAANFTGGVRVAAADVDGDGRADIITGAGPGGGPHVKVFSGATGQTIRSFFAYSANFTGGVYVTGGDFNGDGFADIATGAGKGGGPHVRVFNGVNLSELASTFAYEAAFNGGVRVYALDVNFDNRVDLVTAPGPGRQPLVKTYSLTGSSLVNLSSYMAYDPTFLGGVWVG